jgi:predicted Ser/Thr protein kinase
MPGGCARGCARSKPPMADDTDDRPGPDGMRTVILQRTEPGDAVDETVRAPRPGTEGGASPAGPVHTIGRYETLAEVGRGAHGTVYRALDPTIRRTVALKVVAAEEDEFPGGAVPGGRSAFFEREAQAAGALLHPGIVTLYDAGRDGDRYYLAMEFVEGETFAAEIARAGRLPIERTIEVVAAVAEALDFAHERGVVHRDIKPANLMILPDRSVKVADFGIARLTSGAASATMTAGMMVGTPSYMSPEQVQGEPVDGRSDLYSLGCVLYESLTGRKPFRAETMAALLTQILTVDPPPPSSVDPAIPEALDGVVLRGIARDRERRYQRGRDLARELRAAVEVALPKADEPRPRRRWLAIVAVLLALVGAGVLAARQWSKPATGFVVATSDPVGAEVVVDGEVLGQTPNSFEVPEGAHEIEYRKDGYFTAQATIKVPASGRVTVPLDLVPETEERP